MSGIAKKPKKFLLNPILSLLILICAIVALFGKEGTSETLSITVNFLFLIVLNLSFASGLYVLRWRNLSRSEFFFELVALVFTALANIFLFANIYSLLGITSSAGLTKDSFDCLYFSIVTWTTLGYGDFSPTESARFLAATEALLGYTYMAILTGLFLTLFTRKDDNE